MSIVSGSISRQRPRRRARATSRGLFCAWFALLLHFVTPNVCADELKVRPGAGTAPPNIILFLLDDVGVSDLSPFGGEIDTPNIARVATSGVIVERFYTAARCSPTRAGMLSGRHPHDVGMADLARGPVFRTSFSAYQGQLPRAMPLVSELLQAGGYETYMQGKWHLGELPGIDVGSMRGSVPNHRGFDHVWGFHSAQAYPYPAGSRHPYHHNGKPIEVTKGWYSVDKLNALMLAQLEEQLRSDRRRPFFIYFSSQTAHTPFGAPADLVDKYRKVYDRPLLSIWEDRFAAMKERGLFPAAAGARPPAIPKDPGGKLAADAAERAAMIEATDAAFGRLLALLEQAGELDNTLVVVASDNGASPHHGLGRVTNSPFRGAKGNLWEGGIRSPLVVSWPAGGMEKGETVGGVATFLDLAPTFLGAAGIAYPPTNRDGQPLDPLPGRNLLPMLRAGRVTPPDYFFWNDHGRFALLKGGRWKLLGDPVYDGAAERAGAEPYLSLFDVQSDPAETRELSAREPALVRELLGEYRRWAEGSGAVPYYKVLDAYEANRGPRVRGAD